MSKPTATKGRIYPDDLGGADYAAAEAEVRTFWERHDVFRRSERERADRAPFVFYEGPPTANGRPGVHHAISRLIKDVFCRYKTMTGHLVLRKAGWDTHGLPVEIEVEKELGLKSKEDVEAYGIEAFNAKCRESVFKYKKEWDEFTQRFGFWLDLDDPYVTYADEYIESVWWILRQLWDKGLLYCGHKVVPYCTRCETALSSHEVAQGYKDVDDPSITVKMKAKDADYSFLVWTTTPWTLPSNVALAVGQDIDYVLVEKDGERSMLAESRLGHYFGDEAKVLQRLKGQELVGRRYHQLIEVLKVDRPAFLVIAADFVSTEDGTGIVHLAPAYGEDDARAGREHDLPTLHPIDKSGRFGPEMTPYAGLAAKESDRRIMADLKAQGKVLRIDQVRHSYPHCWRCATPLLYYARDCWYVRTTQLKEQLIAANEQVNWVPAGAGKERFGDWLRHNVDWALSRDRFWGTPLPIWGCESCGHRVCVGSRAEIEERGGTPPPDLHRPFVDDVVLTCEKCAADMRRTPEVIDVWFDSGAMPYAQWHYPFENGDKFLSQFPADFISEGIDQTRGWFYSLLAIATMLDGQSSYRNVIALGLILDKHGQKMSKSKGNSVDPLEIIEEDGADALRWYMSVVSPPWTPTRFDPEGVKEHKRRTLATLENVYAFFALYANVDGYRAGPIDEPARLSNQLDRWLYSRFQAVVTEVRESLERWDTIHAGRVLGDFVVDELSNWYVRRSRRRFWKGELTDDKRAAYDTLFLVLEGTSRMLAPFVPFLAERLYRGLHATQAAATDSVHLAEFPTPHQAGRDQVLESRMAAVLQVVSLGRSLRSRHEIRTRQPLPEALVYSRASSVRQAIEDEQYAALIADELNIKRILWLDDPSRVAKVTAKGNFRNLGQRFGKATPKVAQAIAGLSAASLGELRENGVLAVEVEGRSLRIVLDDVFIQEEGLSGFVSESSREVMLALNVELDDELRQEGLARELINRIQNLRKDEGLEVTDRIRLGVRGDHDVHRALESHRERICTETLAVELDDAASGESFSIDDHAVTISIRKA